MAWLENAAVERITSGYWMGVNLPHPLTIERSTDESGKAMEGDSSPFRHVFALLSHSLPLSQKITFHTL